LIQATIKDSTTTLDISGFNTRFFYLKQPSGTTTTITANLIGGSGTSGVIGFTSTAAHFDQMGRYKLQVYLSNGTSTWRSDVYEFSVSANII
jgi:hypothetical protein